MSSELFDQAAAAWDAKPMRRELARAVAGAIRQTLDLDRSMAALEVGSGTGLVTLELAPSLGSVLATDTSPGMLAELEKKKKALGADNLTTMLVDLSQDPTPLAGQRFQLVFSSMTLHHLEEPDSFLATCFALLSPGGHIALADLEKEDGSFHSDMTGVRHLGFEPSQLVEAARKLGFRELRCPTVHRICKQDRLGRPRDYPVFLLTGRRP